MEFGISKDEKIMHYLGTRSHEACWRLLKREIHTQVPAVMAPLTVHEKDHQNIQDPLLMSMLGQLRADNSKTTLIGYFERNRTD
jgi:hypothetical protein